MQYIFTINYDNNQFRGNIEDLFKGIKSKAIEGLYGGIDNLQNRVKLNRFELIMTDGSNKIFSNKICNLIVYDEKDYNEDDEDEGEMIGSQATFIKNKYFSMNPNVINIGSIMIEFLNNQDSIEMFTIYFGFDNKGKLLDAKIEGPYGKSKYIKYFELQITIELILFKDGKD